jgi:hypothetical protein
MLGFKEFNPVEYRPGEDDQVNHNAIKRKRQDEALSIAQRRARSRMLKRIRNKLKIGRKRAMMRTANPQVLKKRANKQARNLIFKKLTKGKTRSELPPARRAEIEKRLDKMKGRIQKIAMRILPKVRKMEIARKKGQKVATDKKQAAGA